jgi:DNA-binding response OmpR family regulator
MDDEALDLTAAEYAVLKLLVQHRGTTVSKEQILYDSEVFQFGSDASLAVILNRLRKKLGEEVQLKTVRGVGYRLLS